MVKSRKMVEIKSRNINVVDFLLQRIRKLLKKRIYRIMENTAGEP